MMLVKVEDALGPLVSIDLRYLSAKSPCTAVARTARTASILGTTWAAGAAGSAGSAGSGYLRCTETLKRPHMHVRISGRLGPIFASDKHRASGT